MPGYPPQYQGQMGYPPGYPYGQYPPGYYPQQPYANSFSFEEGGGQPQGQEATAGDEKAVVVRSRSRRGSWLPLLFTLLIMTAVLVPTIYFGWPLVKDAINNPGRGKQVVAVRKPTENNKSTPSTGGGEPNKSGNTGTPTTGGTTTTPKKGEQPKAVEPVAKRSDGIFPRRALLISVENYLLLNPVHYGADSERVINYPGSSTGVLFEAFQNRPFNVHADQITELSDGLRENQKNPLRKARAPLKDVVEETLADFCKTSRPQDRIIILFAGHAVEIEKEAYLIPIEGNKDDAKTLIPLAWVYEQLKKSPARQKLLILDVNRHPTSRGYERPGTGEMSEGFDTIVQNPPPGVQVWTSCVKGQQSIELNRGSAFLQALCGVLAKGIVGISEPEHPLPLDKLVPEVNQRLKELLGAKVEQVSRLVGVSPEGQPYDPSVPMPPRLAIAVPESLKDAAPPQLVQSILDELNIIPPVRGESQALRPSHLPPFSSKLLEEYETDQKFANFDQLRAQVMKDAEKYPLRAAVVEAIEDLRKSNSFTFTESLFSPGGATLDPKVKAKFLETQKEPGKVIFGLENSLAKLVEVEDKRDEEKSKRWQVTFDYAKARLQSRLVYIYEYNYQIGQIRADNLPQLEPQDRGWRLGSNKKVAVTESKVKSMVKDIGKSWKRIAEEHAGTPWAMLAVRENLTSLGLQWLPLRE